MTRSKNSTKLIALLMSLVLITSCFVGGTLARYITSTSSEDSARVAVWGINADEVEMDLFDAQYELDGTVIAKANDGDNIIAPGTGKMSKFSIVNLDDTLAPEVMYEVRIGLDDTEIDQRILDNPSIQWKLDNNSWGTWESTKADILALSGDASGVKTYAPNTVATEFANGVEHTISWQWLLDNNNDTQDTTMGNEAVDEDIIAKIIVKVTAEQVNLDTTGMLEGNGSTYNVNTPTTLMFRANDNYENFEKVKINGDEISDSNYIAENGSIKITLKEDYLKTLSIGTHIITIISSEKETNGTFKVINNYTSTSSTNILKLNNVDSKPHNLNIQLNSDSITDFSDITVYATGKNLLDLNSGYNTVLNKNIADINIDINTNSLSFTKVSAPQTSGMYAVKVYLPAGSYTLSLYGDSTKSFNMTKIDTNTLVTNRSIHNGFNSFNINISDSAFYSLNLGAQYNEGEGTECNFSNIQLEANTISTDFEPYKGQVILTNKNGTISGLSSISPTTVLIADNPGVSISCDYKNSYTPADTITTKPTTISKTLSTMYGGDVLTLETNAIKKNKTLSFSGNISNLDTIIFKHGEELWGTGQLSIDNTNIKTYRYNGSETVLVSTIPHGLTISGETNLIATIDHLEKMSITLTSNNETFTKNNLAWYGSRGAIELESVNTELTNVELTWECEDYNKDIWFFGDSYFEINSTRWPYYILTEQDNFLLSGYGGASSSAMYADFITALTHGTPKYAIWCLGMNNGDTESSINSSYKEYTEKFIEKCHENGIIPILSTIPNTPTVINIHKNEYVRNSGYRYIDFATAVGANEKGSSWTTGMLSSDNIHPDTLGGKALAEQIYIDLPEILE